MTPDQRLAEIRRRVRKFRAMTIDDKMATPGFAYGCMADEAFLLEQLDLAQRQAAHTPATLPIVILPPPLGPGPAPIPQPPITPPNAGSFEVGWNAAVAQCESAVQTAISAGIHAKLDLYDIRHRAVASVRAVRRATPALPEAPAFQQPDPWDGR